VDWQQGVLIILTCIVGGLVVGYLLSYLITTRILRKPFSKKRKLTEQQFEEQLTREVEEAGKVREAEEWERKEAAVVKEPLESVAPDLVAEVENNRRMATEPWSDKLLRLQIITRILRKPFSKKRKLTEQQFEEQLTREVKGARKLREAEERERKEAAMVEEPLESIAPDLLAEVKNNRRIATEPWAGKLLSFQTHAWDTNQDEIHKLPANVREDLTQAYLDMRLANSIVWLSTELGRRSHNLDENYMKLCTNIAVRLNRITPLLK